MTYLFIIQDLTPLDSNSIIKPLLEYGLIALFLIGSIYLNIKQYFGHKTEVSELNIERDKERKYLFDKLDDARQDALNQAKEGQKELLDVSNKFIEITNDLKMFYANKTHFNG